MNKNTFLLSFLILLFSCSENRKDDRVNLIFDTDIGPDYDDVGAIAMLHALADSGHVDILATVASSKYPAVGRVLDVFNTYFGRPDLPIGVPRSDAVTDKDWQNWSDSIIVKYPHSVNSNEEVPDAVDVYREILARQPDSSVTIVTIGFLTNLGNLLDSPADKFSELNGKDLIKSKVKLLVSMAGKFPEGREYNVYKDAQVAKKVFDNWPSNIIFSGFEVGEKIKTGIPLIQNNTIRKSPVKDVYRISIPKAKEDSSGRMSWDQTAVLVAVKGASPYFDLIPGTMITKEDGSNSWDNSQEGHFYLVQKWPVQEITSLIDNYMMHQPSN